MKWAGIIVAALVLLIALVAFVGASLPKSHKASRRAMFHRPPEEVYQAISGGQEWRSDVKRVEPVEAEGGRARWREYNARGERVTFELIEDSPPNRRSVRIADKDLPFGGTWTFEISPQAGGCELRITEDGEIYNPIFRFVARFFMGYTRSIETYLRDLGKKFGEDVTQGIHG